ncbi:MAG: hypothetical protein MJZ73_06565 [Bacteroidaceae bacterium]|nr:hypothetical protein [Bacteroidaceae bacterium]
MKALKFAGLALLLAACQSGGIDNAATQKTLAELQENFQNPPQSARTQVWWHWMNGNITKDGIKKDLEWMKRIGLGGFHHFDAALGTPTIVDQRLIYMHDDWKDAFAYATQKADSLGLEMTVASAPGWSATGGPWVEPKDGMKKLVWKEVLVNGGSSQSIMLPAPFTTTGAFQNAAPAGRGQANTQEYYEDVAVVALKLTDEDKTLEQLGAKVTVNGNAVSMAELTDGDLMNGPLLPMGAQGYSWIQYEFPQDVTVRSMVLAAGSNGGMTLECSNDGKEYKEVCPVRSGRVAQSTISLPATTARYFRLKVNNPRPAGPSMFGMGGPAPAPKGCTINEFNLYTTSRVNQAEVKAAYAAGGHYVPMATPASAGEQFAQATDVIDLTSMVKNGVLTWDAPEGNWRVYRFGFSLTGKMNHPAPPEATGLEVDKLDPIAFGDYMRKYLDMYKEASQGMVGQKGIQYVLTDSYEAEHETWTPAMFDEFKNRRGYDLHQWLPVLTGDIVGSPEQSDAFLRDWRLTIGDLIASNYDLISKIAKEEYGMKGRYSEAHEAGRVYTADGMAVKETAEVPMSAMWCSAPWLGKDKDGVTIRTMYMADDKESGSVAHIFGQNIAAAESMTAWGELYYGWYPENLKTIADIELAEGINRFVIHESAHQPSDAHVPGLSLGGIGQWFNRHDTWAEQAVAWVDYMSRRSYMLQQGKNLADVLVYYGEDDNITSLYGNGAPTVPAGYQFDYCNPTALTKVLQFKNGNLYSTASGTQYKLLWLDKNVEYMSVSILKKLAELAKAGALIGGEKPQHPLGLADSQEEFDQLVAEIWDSNRANVSTGIAMEEVLKNAGVQPDIQTEEGIKFLHRTLDHAEIYWINRPVEDSKTITVSFRTAGRVPQVWHPETGKIEEVSYKIEGERTTVTLELTPNDAVFVVFGVKAEQMEVTLPAKVEKTLLTVDTPWAVKFQEKRGAPAEATFDRLASYTESEEFGIKYFSGTANYQNTLKVGKLEGKAILDLGEVHELAEVIVNGTSAGIIWKKPFRVDITSLLKEGDNQLEVKVTNVWVNRLIGDQQSNCPEKITFTDSHYYNPDSPLQPAGLVGPVQLIEVK